MIAAAPDRNRNPYCQPMCRVMTPPTKGASAVPSTSAMVSTAYMRASSRSSKRSPTLARETVMPTPPVAPCTTRATTNQAIVGAK